MAIDSGQLCWMDEGKAEINPGYVGGSVMLEWVESPVNTCLQNITPTWDLRECSFFNLSDHGSHFVCRTVSDYRHLKSEAKTFLFLLFVCPSFFIERRGFSFSSCPKNLTIARTIRSCCVVDLFVECSIHYSAIISLQCLACLLILFKEYLPIK